MPPFLAEQLQFVPTAMDQWFWPDGEVRMTGRQLNGLIESPCWEGGDFSCLSCHSLHDSDPEDQLAEGLRGDRACNQCHATYAASIESHTRHPADSDGSRCYNCHMPHTTDGPLKASRSHTVQSPSVAVALALLAGDAGERALAAWAIGWECAREASGTGWIAPLLARGLDDPYDVVRYIAGRSLRRLPGFDLFVYDFVASPHGRHEALERAVAVWEQSAAGAEPRAARVLLDAAGRSRAERIRQLVALRDDRPMVLAE